MKCSETESHLQELLDNRESVASDPILESHLEDCSSCKQVANDYMMLFQIEFGARALSAPKPPKPALKHREFMRRWSGIGKFSCAAAAIFIIIVQPIIWSWYEVSQPVAVSGKSVSVQNAERTIVASTHQELVDETQEVQMDVASLLDVSSTLSIFDVANITPREFTIVKPISSNTTISRMIKSLSKWNESSDSPKMNQPPAMENDQERLRYVIDTCRQLFS